MVEIPLSDLGKVMSSQHSEKPEEPPQKDEPYEQPPVATESNKASDAKLLFSSTVKPLPVPKLPNKTPPAAVVCSSSAANSNLP